jgi:hypothetical protein
MPQTSEEGKSKTSEGGESVVEKAWAAGLNFSCDSGGGSGSGRLQPLEPYKNEDVVRLWYPLCFRMVFRSFPMLSVSDWRGTQPSMHLIGEVHDPSLSIMHDS